MKVLVDIGNTNVLMGKYDNSRLIDQVRFETNTVISSPDDILKNLCIFLANVEYVLISGVVPQAQKNLRILISKNFENLSIRELNTSDLEAFIKFNVINPAEVGDDRIINSIAAIDKYEPPFIIVDFGTATTLDVVDKSGAYSGGLICPGVNLSIKSLSDGAALLPLITFKKPETLIGKHTIAAMESGIYWGYISLIEGLIERLKTSDLEAFIKFNVINSAEVGDDRIINSIAAIDKYEPPFIIVDFGTATTLDVVDKSGAYSGGLICPGVNLSIKSLSDGAALLPLITFKKPETLIGKNTIAAMESGIYWGYVSLIEGLIERLKTSHECFNAKAIATGGLSKLFENDLKCINYFERDLTLEGLLIVSNKLQ